LTIGDGLSLATTTLSATAKQAPSLPGGRLTLTTAVPVTSADVTAAGTIYYTPYVHNRVWLYSGSAWVEHTFTERSLALTVTDATNYDVFLYNNSGTLTLELTAWTNDTTRATALTTQDGVLVKTGATTRLYLGTIRASGSNTTEDSMTKRFVWNYYHRRPRLLRRLETTDSWTYSTATLRQANGSTANQVDVVVGVAEALLVLHCLALASGDNVTDFVLAAIGEDSTSAFVAGQLMGIEDFASTGDISHAAALLSKYPAIGRHYYAWLEKAGAAGTTTWRGDNGAIDGQQSGLSGWIEG
jgi:hypothetical protein